MKNSAGRGRCYPPRPKAEVDNILEICRILHILRKPNSIILLYDSFKIFSSLKLLNLLAAIFLLNKNNTISSPALFGQQFNNLQRAALLTSF